VERFLLDLSAAAATGVHLGRWKETMEASAESEMECKEKGTSAFGVAKKKRDRGHASYLSQKTHLRLSINTAEATSRGFAAAPLSVIVMARETKVVAGAGEREKKRKKKAN